MPVINFECQIAKSQISRYLAGENLSSLALSQLEEHISGCEECKELIARRRVALQTMMIAAQADVSEGVSSQKAVADVAKRERKVPSLSGLRAKALASVRSPSSPEASPTALKKTKMKPLALSVALAGVLLAMGYLQRSGMGLFGPSAAATLPSQVADTHLPALAASPKASLAGHSSILNRTHAQTASQKKKSAHVKQKASAAATPKATPKSASHSRSEIPSLKRASHGARKAVMRRETVAVKRMHKQFKQKSKPPKMDWVKIHQQSHKQSTFPSNAGNVSVHP